MIPIPSGVRVWIAAGHTDMRRGMQGLALMVQESLKRDPHAGDLYIFRGRRGDLAKILWHDGVGLSLYAKRLDRGKFCFDLRDDGRKGAASVAGFVLDAVPLIGIVAGGDHEAPGCAALADEEGNRGSRAGFVGEPDGSPGSADDVGDGGGNFVRCEAMVVADEDAGLAAGDGGERIGSDGVDHLGGLVDGTQKAQVGDAAQLGRLVAAAADQGLPVGGVGHVRSMGLGPRDGCRGQAAGQGDGERRRKDSNSRLHAGPHRRLCRPPL